MDIIILVTQYRKTFLFALKNAFCYWELWKYMHVCSKGIKYHLEVAHSLSASELWEGGIDESDSELQLSKLARRHTYMGTSSCQ